MKRAHGLVFAAMLIVYCAAHAGDPGQSSAPANSAVASGSFPKQLVLEWYLETSATGQHLYKEIGVSPDGQFMYVADVYEDAVLVFRTDDAATPIESFSDISWAQAGVWPYAVDVAMDGMVYVSTFDVNGDAINDNALLRWDPVGKVLTRLCDLPQPVRGIQVSGQGLNTVVYASGNGRPPEPGIVLRCTPVSSDVFAVETLFSTGVYLNQQDVAARNGGKDLYVSTWSHDRREGYPDAPLWTPYESMVTRWNDQGQRDDRFSVSYLPPGNVPSMVLNPQMDRLYCFHLDIGLGVNNVARLYKVSPLTGKKVDEITIAAAGTSGGGGIDLGLDGEIYLSWTVETRNGFRISALAKVRDRTVGEDAQGGVGTPLARDVTDPGSRPTDFVLEQNYPNPFNPSTTIRYGLPIPSQVTLTVFNTVGAQVATLVEEHQGAGYHEVRFDASDLASGVYIYRLQTASSIETRKLMFLK